MSEFTYTIDSAQARNIGANMTNITNAIRRRLDDQENEIQNYLSQWSAEDKLEYEARRKEWMTIAGHMPVALNNATDCLEGIVQSYEQATRKGANAWSNYSAR